MKSRLRLYLLLLLTFCSPLHASQNDEDIWKQIQKSVEEANREESPEEIAKRERSALELQTRLQEDLETAWSRAAVYVPGSLFPTRPDKVSVKDPTPVMVFMHGCTGISSHDSMWAKFVSDLGFIVVMPDSMARPGRVSNCDAQSAKVTGRFPLASEFRSQEIESALVQLLRYPWTHKDQIFLMGHSEGGASVARAKSGQIRGLIISGWSCTNRFIASFNGIFAPSHIPVLAIADRDDFWYRGTQWQGQCIDHAAGREDFTQIDLKGGDHATYPYAEARKAVRDFLTRLSSGK